MMKRKILYTLLAFGMVSVSCSKSGLEAPRRPGEPNGTPVTVALASVSAPAPVEASDCAAGTKSSAELTEGAVDGQIHDLWAIQYDKDGNLVGSPYYTADIPAGTAGTAGSGTDYSYDGLSVKLTSSGADDHTVCFVANTHNGSLFTADNDVSTLDKLTKTAAMGFGNEYKPTASGGILMTGRYTGVVESGTPVTGVKLERLAAKIILKYKSALDGFTVTGIQLKNVPAAFGFADAPAEDVNFPAVADGSHIDYPADAASKAETDGDYKRFVWYMPENISRTTTTVTAIGDRTLDKSNGRPAYVEVTGVLNTDERVRKAVYRILLGDPSLDMGNFQVKRNHIYTVTLDIEGLNVADNRVTVESFDMSNCAMLQPAAVAGKARDSVTFDIRKCLNNGFTTQADLNALMTASSAMSADVFWQDGNVLNTEDVKLDKVNGLLTVKSSKTTEGNAVVVLYPTAYKNRGSILWSWHIWVTGYHPDLLEDGTTPLGVGTRAANSSIKVVAGQVHTYGAEFQRTNGMNKVIMDRNLGATKSYNGRVPAANDATADQAFGLFYQWGRKDPFPRADGATIDVTTAKANTIPIYGPDGTTVLREDNGTGYVQMDISSVPQQPGGNSLASSVKDPLAFITNTITPFDWYTEAPENQNNGLWGDGGSKSAYDPCPKGWRVPPTGTWNDFTRDQYVPANGTCPYYINGGITESGGQYFATNGRFYNNQVWYPAAGDRSSKSGELLTIGSRGYVWSSAISGIRSLNMSFSMSGLSPSITNNRSFGFQVRCVQE